MNPWQTDEACVEAREAVWDVARQLPEGDGNTWEEAWTNALYANLNSYARAVAVACLRACNLAGLKAADEAHPEDRDGFEWSRFTANRVLDLLAELGGEGG